MFCCEAALPVAAFDGWQSAALDHWRDTVLELLQSRRMLTGLPLALGPLEGHRLALNVPALTKALGELIRNGTLGATQYELAANAPLRRVA